jgi:hypothetical protein
MGSVVGQPLLVHWVVLVTHVPSAQRTGQFMPHCVAEGAQDPSGQVTPWPVAEHPPHAVVSATQRPLHNTGSVEGQPLVPHWVAAMTQVPSAQRMGQVEAHWVSTVTQVPSGQRTGRSMVQPLHAVASRTHWPLHRMGAVAGQPLVRHWVAAMTHVPSLQRTGQVEAHCVSVAAQVPSGQRTGVAPEHVVQAVALATHTPLHR